VKLAGISEDVEEELEGMGVSVSRIKRVRDLGGFNGGFF
jgi:hypothetical protein